MIIQVYAASTDAEKEETDKFYGQIQSEITRTCKKMAGNQNTKIIKEKNVIGLHELGIQNKARK